MRGFARGDGVLELVRRALERLADLEHLQHDRVLFEEFQVGAQHGHDLRRQRILALEARRQEVADQPVHPLAVEQLGRDPEFVVGAAEEALDDRALVFAPDAGECLGGGRVEECRRVERDFAFSHFRIVERMELVLVQPEIPHNSGCAARLSAATGVRLHLVEPLGFSLEDRYLKRAGLDYWPLVDLLVHKSFEALLAELARGSPRPVEERLRLFTARGGSSLFATAFAADDVLVFGCESKGLAPEIVEPRAARRVYVPIRPGVRSLNLANVACLALYTALDRAGVPLPENDGRYEAHPLAAEDVRPSSRVRRVDA